MRESAYKGEVSMYKLNDIHNSDGKGNFEKMVIFVLAIEHMPFVDVRRSLIQM